MSKKLIVILGPTASGKSELTIQLAKKFKGEVVSADSRQIYKGIDIGTGKITKKEMRGIPHYLLDVASPKRRFTVVQYRKLALKSINKIVKNGRVPILCGGSGFYIQALVNGITIPQIRPDWRLRSQLEQLKTGELLKKLKETDPQRAKSIDKKNKRRLIRALEIVIKTKRPVPALKNKPLPYPVLIIGIKKEKKELEQLIEKRFLKWLKQGFLQEVQNLKKTGLSWKKIEDFGIHYRQASQYLQEKIDDKEFIQKSLIGLKNYAKRQMTWFKRDKRIYWVKDYKEAEKSVREFFKKTTRRVQ